ncbi:hypothetical protein [Pseudonocardia asaccharolytica]|uniref:Uncharacterized protein n=1 Tax=Pseudonocardia asaccharolytica DSM 44247 = NBRC 16224 TaxID=1123024 RepID=A0A511D6Q0_9PSEU|nr:hypothetical protein [Pseudonocardia asaccharolytica]GEL20461.1 hypothetical protein PA7_42980 [Pseudonocardia asaccharolytica DSM 44247 = NBRC 16224]
MLDIPAPVVASGALANGASWTLRIGGTRAECHAQFHLRHLQGGFAEIAGPIPTGDQLTSTTCGSTLGRRLFFALGGLEVAVVQLSLVAGPPLELAPLHTADDLGVRAFFTLLDGPQTLLHATGLRHPTD